MIPTMYSWNPDGTLSGVTFYLDGKPYQANETLPVFDQLVEELKKATPDAEKLIRLTQPVRLIEKAVEEVIEADYLPKGVVSVTKNSVSYNGEEINGVLVDRILNMLAQGFDIMPMVRLLENIYQNPALWVRDELYTWLELSTLPITVDGHFLAYKNVNGDFTSIHDGKTMNAPGTVVTLPRSQVNPERARICSSGLHFCSKSYLPHFSHGRNNTTILLKINPADVVSVPLNETAKGRTWRYEVLSVVEHDPQTYEWPAVVAEDGSEIEDDDFDDIEFTDEEVEDILAAAEEYQTEERARINGLGTIALRREASQAGLKHAWEQRNSVLRNYLLARVA